MILRNRRLLGRWLLAASLGAAVQCLPSLAQAANVCAGGGLSHPVIGTGIGGTGAPQSSGMGGTGTPAHGSGSGIGGTGNTAGNDSGLGGTGNVASHGSGIGGTGDVAGIGGTGIVGTITGFGSICVNGVEIHYDTKTPTWMDGQPAAANSLAIGQVVSVDAQGAGPQVRARTIQVLYAVTGPVTRVTPGGRLQVLGQRVQLPAGPRASMAVRPGDFVQVSGLRRADGVIVASRIHPAPRGRASVTGPVTALTPGHIRVYGTNIALGGSAAPAGLGAGRIVHVSGHVDAGGTLRADHVALQRGLPFGAGVQHLSIEGYIRNSRGHQLVNVGGTEVQISRTTHFASGRPDELKQDTRVRVSGRVGTDHRLHAERIEVERERPEPVHALRTEAHTSHDHGDHIGHDDHRNPREGADRPSRPEPPSHDDEHVEKVDRPDHVERPESPERPESVERPESPERPESVERPESPERPESIERPEIETPDN